MGEMALRVETRPILMGHSADTGCVLSVTKLDPGRRVVAGSFLAAHPAVDAAACETVRQAGLDVSAKANGGGDLGFRPGVRVVGRADPVYRDKGLCQTKCTTR